MWMYRQMMEARADCIGINASCPTGDPRHHGTEGIVVVGVHTRIAGVSVPALPPGCCAALDHVSHEGYVSERSSLKARSECPFSSRTNMRNGVPRKPVVRWLP